MSRQCSYVSSDNGILLCGYYRKLKTMKKKFFVLYNETPSNIARIEYYDNEKKFKSGFSPKRIINIRNCFNINRRMYTKHDFVIVLSSTEGGFGIVMDSEEDMNTWLSHLFALQKTGDALFAFPQFDYVWQVVIQRKGIAEHHNIFGSYHICLTSKAINFIKIGREKKIGDNKTTRIEVLLTTIRRCGDSQCFFYMEVGRQCTLGPGELWMETEDSSTAQNMHRMILSKMISLNEDQIEPMRKRSSSATETCNPLHNSKLTQTLDATGNYLQSVKNFKRGRCDSLPSRNRTSSDCSNHSIKLAPMSCAHNVLNLQVNSAPVVYSTSEESVSIDDSEEYGGMSFILSSRSPESVIPEESSDDSICARNSKKHNKTCGRDIDSIKLNGPEALITDAVTNVSKNLTRYHCKSTDLSTYIDGCSNVDGQFQGTPTCYFGNRGENDQTKETLFSRVRAFSVGSRMKNNSTCLKTRFLHSDDIKNQSIVNVSRKSISVPVLVNEKKFVDQMGDLMEIDFSKSTIKNDTSKIQLSGNECQTTSDIVRNFKFLNLVESMRKDRKTGDNGYLEMKPITIESCNSTCSATVPSNGRQKNAEQSDANQSFIETNYDMIDISSTKKNILENDLRFHYNERDHAHNKNDLRFHYNDHESAHNSTDYNNDTNSDKSTSQEKGDCLNQDLYYASLDLPKCSSEITTRYSFKETKSDTNTQEIKSEYAKLNFDQSEVSACSLKENINMK